MEADHLGVLTIWQLCGEERGSIHEERIMHTRMRGRPFDRETARAIASQKRIGRIKRAVRRQFILSDGEPILTRSVLERAYPRLSRFTDWHYLAARRALRQEAVIVGRNRYGRGRPNLWAPKRDMTAT